MGHSNIEDKDLAVFAFEKRISFFYVLDRILNAAFLKIVLLILTVGPLIKLFECHTFLLNFGFENLASRLDNLKLQNSVD